MALRIATRLPRLVIVGVVLLLASATLAVGAAKRADRRPAAVRLRLVAVATIVVPDCRARRSSSPRGRSKTPASRGRSSARSTAMRRTRSPASRRPPARGCAIPARRPSPSPSSAPPIRRRAVPRTFRRTPAPQSNPSDCQTTSVTPVAPVVPAAPKGSADEAGNEEGRTEGGCSDDQAPAAHSPWPAHRPSL